MILEFTSQAKAEACLSQIEHYGRLLFAENGYQVIGDEIVPKTGGADRLDVQRTVRWDEVQVSPDGKHYFASPRNRYPEYYDIIVSGFESDFVEKNKPASWNVFQETP